MISADRLILLGIARRLTARACGCSTATRSSASAPRAVAENERSASALGLLARPHRHPQLGARLRPRRPRRDPDRPDRHPAAGGPDQPRPGRDRGGAGRRRSAPSRSRSSPASSIGIAQTEVTRYVEQTGVGTRVPVHPDRRLAGGPRPGAAAARLPAAAPADDRHRPHQLARDRVRRRRRRVPARRPRPPIWIDAFTVTLCIAVVLLSIVVLTGYAGQLSLAQFAFAGFGAYVAGGSSPSTTCPFWLGAAHRRRRRRSRSGCCSGCRRCERAASTWRSSRSAWAPRSSSMLFGNTDYTGGFQGTQIGDPSLFGLDINAIPHPTRYGLFALGLLRRSPRSIVANVRRGRSRAPADRGAHERARRGGARHQRRRGEALRLRRCRRRSPALGGILLAFRTTSINYSRSPLHSITTSAYAMIGGIGYLFGPVIGASSRTAAWMRASSMRWARALRSTCR